jgi:ribonuclease D
MEKMLERAMEYLRKTSEENALDAPFVAPRAEVHALVSEGAQSSSETFRVLRGWRRALVGEDLMRLVSEEPR